MSKDYKPAAPKAKPASKGNPFLSGLMVGLLLGIGLSVGVALYVKKGESSFEQKVKPAPELTTGSKPDEKNPAGTTPPVAQPANKEDRFTFYGILTGNESPVSEQEVKQATEQKTPETPTGEKPAAPRENYFLQVGAYQTEQEADNTKAKLALIGLEAVVQTATIPEKGVLHRVRVGPLTNIDEISKARSELARNGFDAALIKIHNNVPDQ